MNNITMEQHPRISAVMLAGRVSKSDILEAIKCFNKQTYPNKELIILNNTKNHFEASKLAVDTSENIFIIDTPVELNAGMARNFGIRAANGQILAQFDANYWYHPQRLESQIMALANNEAHICVLAKIFRYSYASGNATKYTNEKNAILSTMVFIRPANIDYPSAHKHEEFGILDRMTEAGMKSVSISREDLACKFLFTDGKQINNPTNIDLSKKHFTLVKKIVRDRLKH